MEQGAYLEKLADLLDEVDRDLHAVVRRLGQQHLHDLQHHKVCGEGTGVRIGVRSKAGAVRQLGVTE